MTDVAIVANHFSRVADVLAVMTTKTTGRVKMSDIVRMSGPVGLHLREKVGLEDALRFADCCFYRVSFLRVQLAVAGSVKTIQARCDRVECFLLGGVGFVQ